MALEKVGVQTVAEGVGAFVRDMGKAQKAYTGVTDAISKGSKKLATDSTKSFKTLKEKLLSTFGRLSTASGSLKLALKGVSDVFGGLATMGGIAARSIFSIGKSVASFGKSLLYRIPIVRSFSRMIGRAGDAIRFGLIPQLAQGAKAVLAKTKSFIVHSVIVRKAASAYLNVRSRISELSSRISAVVTPAIRVLSAVFSRVSSGLKKTFGPAIQAGAKILSGFGKIAIGIVGIAGNFAKAWIGVSSKAMQIAGKAFIKVGSAIPGLLLKGFKGAAGTLGAMIGKTLGKAASIAGMALKGIGKVAGVALKGAGIALMGIGIAAGATVMGIGGIGVALGKLAIKTAPLEGIGIAFDKMAARAGLSLDTLRKASVGTISDFDLMKSANVALTGAGAELGKEFGTKLPALMEIARAAAKAMGQDTGFMFESLVTGIKRSAPMLIDNTGLQLKMGEANAALAEQLGKTVDELTAEEKQIALLDATLAAGKAMVDDFGGGQLTAAERMAQFRAQVQNTKDQVGLALLPALQAVLKPLSSLATDVGPRVIEWAHTAGDVLATAIPQALDTIRNALGRIRGWIEANWPAVSATILNTLMVVRDWVETNWPTIRDTVLYTFAAIRDWVETNWPVVQATILGVFSAIHSWIILNWPIVRDTVLGTFAAIRDWVETNWPMVRDTVLNTFAAIRDWVTTNWPTIQDTVLNTFGEIQSWVETNWPTIRDTVLSSVEAIRSWFVTNWPIIQAAAVTAWMVIQDVVMAVVDVIVGQVWPSLQEAFASIEDIMDTFGFSWADVWEAVKKAVRIVAAAIGAILLALVGVIAGIANAIAGTLEFVADTFEKMAASVKRIIEGIAGIIGGGFAIIRGIFTGDTALIRAGFEGWWEGIKSLVSGALGVMIETFKFAFGTVLVLVWNFIEGFIEFFKSLYDKLVGHSIVPEMMKAIVSAVTTGMTNVVTTMGTKMGEVIGAITGKLGDLKKAGAAIVGAIRSGIANAWGALVAWFKGKLASLADMLPFSEPKDPTSPLRHLSKAGEAIVGNIAAGFDTGATKFASSLAGMMAMTGPMMAAAPRLAGTTSTSTTTNVNVTTGDIVNGMDVAQLRSFILQTVGEAI